MVSAESVYERGVLMLRSIFSFLDSILFVHRVYKIRPVDFHGLPSVKWGPEDEEWNRHPGRWQTCEGCRGKGGLGFENRPSSLVYKILVVFLVILLVSIWGGIWMIRHPPP